MWNASEKYPDHQVGSIVKSLVLTGRRRGEVLSLLWEDVDLDTATYTIRDTKSGKFLSCDKMGGKVENPQSWNRYLYCMNNPLKYIDPTGEESILVVDDNINPRLLYALKKAVKHMNVRGAGEVLAKLHGKTVISFGKNE